jgi:agmatinase
LLNRPWPEEFCQVRGRFLAAQNWDQLGKADAPFALLGAPLDITTSFRSGTGQGPEAIRAASQVLEDYSLELDRDLNAQAFADLGDLPLVPGDLVGSLELIEQAVAHLVAAGGRPFLLGGEHLVTLPVVRALAAVYPDLAVLQFDAHADLRNHYLGWQLSHATVMRRVAGIVGPAAVWQFGIRSADREEAAYGRAHTHLYPGERLLAGCQAARQALANRPVYITIDIDVCDPGFAPGTGTPEPGGTSPGKLLRGLRALAGLSVVGLDLVEVCPPYDPSGITAILAARLIRDCLLLF